MIPAAVALTSLKSRNKKGGLASKPAFPLFRCWASLTLQRYMPDYVTVIGATSTRDKPVIAGNTRAVTQTCIALFISGSH